jgi:cellulose biosynthesis protein BcsQ
VIDTPPNLAQLTVNALAIADLVLAPINLEDEGAAQGLIELQARMGELERVRCLARLPAKPALLPFYNRSNQRAEDETRLSAQAITEALEDLAIRAARTRISRQSRRAACGHRPRAGRGLLARSHRLDIV